MFSGLAPGRLALTAMVGKSTFGRSLTGRSRYPATPNSTMPIMSNTVMTGRRMKIAVRFILTGHAGPVIDQPYSNVIRFYQHDDLRVCLWLKQFLAGFRFSHSQKWQLT